MFTRLMKSGDPDVLAAAILRDARLRDSNAAAGAWVKRHGGDAAIGQVAFGAFHVLGLRAARHPGMDWIELVASDHGTVAGYYPTPGSPAESQMFELTTYLEPLPGMPQSLTGVHEGVVVHGTPGVLVHNAQVYSVLPFDPDPEQAMFDSRRGMWSAASEVEVRHALVASVSASA